MLIIENKRFQAVSKIAEKFFYSGLYIALITIIGVLGFIFKYEMCAIYIIVFFAALNLALCRDIMPCFLAMAIISMTPLGRYGEVGYFIPKILYVLIFMVPAAITRIILFPPKFSLGRFFFPTLAIAISILIGGLFSISAKDYFKMPALYYTLTLSLGMLFVYLILQSDIPKNKAKVGEYFAKMMVGIGVMGIAMISTHYITNMDLIENNFGYFQSLMQWRNNLSNNLLLSMPFAFYLATKGKNAVLYFIIGILQYIAMVVSFSRGGMIFSTMVFPFVLILTLVLAKKDRIKLMITLAVSIGILYLVVQLWMAPVLEKMVNRIHISGDEARAKLYQLAWENFLKYPIFGTGLGYNGGSFYFPQPMAMYWYHSTIFQILGSLGIAGLLAYGYQSVVRFLTLIEVKSKFNLFTMFSLLGFAAYSMVNVGYFVPLPFVAMVLHMFVVVDRYNNILLNNEELYLKEKLI